MKDILLTADIDMGSISVAMQSDLLYSVNTSQVGFYLSSAQ